MMTVPVISTHVGSVTHPWWDSVPVRGAGRTMDDMVLHFKDLEHLLWQKSMAPNTIDSSSQVVWHSKKAIQSTQGM